MLWRSSSFALLFFALTGCGDAAQDASSNLASATLQRSFQASFTPSAESVRGDWYIVVSNPNPKYYNKIATDYIRYSFREGGEVVKRTNSNGEITIERGSYTLDPDRRTFETTFDLGDAGKQVTSWRQTSPGQAETFYWKNLTLGYEHAEDDQFVKESSADWREREKVTLNTGPPIPSVAPQQVEVGKAYQLSKETSLMPELNPADPISAIERIQILQAGTIIRIESEADNRGTPWYKVQVVGSGRNGWINSIALLGQSLELRQ